ncbi:MAG: amino acid adenylation domain-containing protein [Acidobacteriota bacterium]
MSHRVHSDPAFVTVAGSNAARPPHPVLLHQFFERAVVCWPDRVAVEIPPAVGRPQRRSVTYAQLDARASALAAVLRERVSADAVVGVHLPRTSEHLYVAQLAVLKAGAAYACIDPSFPDAQFQDILHDANAVALLTDRNGVARASACGLDVGLAIDIVDGPAPDATAAGDRQEAPIWLTQHNLAYVIYTSGTTGRPKGVMIEHASIANLVASDIDEFGLSPADRVAQNSSAAYDSSVEEIWLGLAVGATLVVMDDDTARLGPDLVRWLRQERITVLCPPPTMLRAMGCADPATALPDLKCVYVGGEALPRDVADSWAPGRRLTNGWGPTECTVTAIRIDIAAGDPIAIGRPVPGLSACVLDERLEQVPDGVAGELCVSGIGLARGYRHRDALTAERFPAHPTLGRIYRTGDLATRDPEGRFFYHGRIDGQVKIRGYRVELEAIETRLSELSGVREAACRIQDEDAGPVLVACVVPMRADAAPAADDLKEALRKVLPAYMVPGRFGMLTTLPRTVGGKLDRKALPVIEAGAVASSRAGGASSREAVSPRTPLEIRIDAAIRDILKRKDPVGIHDDFFADLGGDSLHAAMLVSLLRDDPVTAHVAVRDIYRAPTIAGLAVTIAAAAPHQKVTHDASGTRDAGHPVIATLAQASWLLGGLFVVSPAIYLAAFTLMPAAIERLGLVITMALLPVLSIVWVALYTPLAVLAAVVAKRVLIGTYVPRRAPAWGGFYVRNWMVQRAVRAVPWRVLGGTVFQQIVLRALGARIGSRVHIHRGVNLLSGGWDLLEIGDDVTLAQDAAINVVEYEDGHIVLAPVSLGSGVTLETRAGVAGGASMAPDSQLAALSFLSRGATVPRGERWDGVPAGPAGVSAPRPAVPGPAVDWSPALHGLLMIAAHEAVASLRVLPLALLSAMAARLAGVDGRHMVAWLNAPTVQTSWLVPLVCVVLAASPLTLALEIALMRALGPVPEGTISRWSPAYLRVWLKTGLVHQAGEWLSGTLFWPSWLRLAGMTIGRDCEISTILDSVPELIEIGPETFFADGIYLGGPFVHRGTVTLARTHVGADSFAGNHAVFPSGQRLPDGILVGVSTRADDTLMRPHTAWFGHPPFELVRREIVEVDRGLTHEPSWMRYLNRMIWEAARSALPLGSAIVVFGWFAMLAAADDAVPPWLLWWGVMPLATLATGAAFCLLVLALKWGLLGRVRPGVHPLWSCWCSRWDFFFVAWQVYARYPLSYLEGTLLLPWYLRAMGMRIGHGVVLGGGYSQVVDPDMLQFDDGATVCCQFQAHTFEDRVLKIGHVRIRRDATVGDAGVLLYGADVGEGTCVLPHSVIMKHERLLPDRIYGGCPTQEVSLYSPLFRR